MVDVGVFDKLNRLAGEIVEEGTGGLWEAAKPNERTERRMTRGNSLVPYRQGSVETRRPRPDTGSLEAEIEILRRTDLAKLQVTEQADLVNRGNQALGDVYFETGAVYTLQLGRIIALKDRIENPEHQAVCAGFFQDLTDRYGARLLENFDAIHDEINRVVSRSVRPAQRQAIVEEIEVSFLDWLRGKKVIVRDR
jgi:hypothetical protein